MRQTRSRSRNKILKPVLPGYVFLADRSCSACIYARAAASTTRLSLGALTTKQQYEFRKEIAWFADPTADIRLALERQIGKTAKICWPHRMAGLCGTFTKLDGEGRLTIVLPFMQQTISVAFDENELEFLN